MVNNFFRDIRIGFRVLIKEKAFCALAVAVLALGIAGVTTMFSVVNGTMLRGFAFPTADRLVNVLFIDPTTQTANGVNGQITSMDYQEMREAQKSFELTASYLNGSTVNMTINGAPVRHTGAYVTEDFLKILGMQPMPGGRDFTADDNKPGAPKVTLIGYAMWQRDFGGAKDIVGTSVIINGTPATIVGVMPEGFAFPFNEEIYLPLYTEFPVRPRNAPVIAPAVMALLKPGVSLDTANAELSQIAKRFSEAYPDTNRQFTTAQVQMLFTTFLPPAQIRGTLWVMLAFCGGVLLIGCMNVMNMQFARATLRAKELAIRSSLGARRARLIRQMLTESLVLAGIGTAVGVLLANGSVRWLMATVRGLENPLPSWIEFRVDGIALVVSAGAMIVAAIVSALLPAWMSSRADAVNVLRDSGRGNTSRTVAIITRGLVVFQLVVTCILLIGSLLQARSIVNQTNIDYGYDTSGVLSARMGLMQAVYPTPDARKQFLDKLILSLQQDPQFEAAALTTRFRMLFDPNSPIEVSGKTYPTLQDRPNASAEQVTGGYFKSLGMKLIDGRDFTSADLDSPEPVAIVNAEFAQRVLGGGNAIGRQFRTSNLTGRVTGPWRTVIGVVSTVRMFGPFANQGVGQAGYYVPFYSNPFGPQSPPLAGQFATVLVRPHAGQDALSLGNALRKAVEKVDPNLPLYFLNTPKFHLDSQLGANRVIASMFLIFGVVAIVLASVGIYGVMSFSVNQRSQEFGVRMALGANTGKILGLVLRQGVWQVGIGLVLGVGASFLIAYFMSAQISTALFGVTGQEKWVYALVASVIAIVSLAATLVPALRASRVDPNVALRAD